MLHRRRVCQCRHNRFRKFSSLHSTYIYSLSSSGLGNLYKARIVPCEQEHIYYSKQSFHMLLKEHRGQRLYGEEFEGLILQRLASARLASDQVAHQTNRCTKYPHISKQNRKKPPNMSNTSGFASGPTRSKQAFHEFGVVELLLHLPRMHKPLTSIQLTTTNYRINQHASKFVPGYRSGSFHKESINANLCPLLFAYTVLTGRTHCGYSCLFKSETYGLSSHQNALTANSPCSI